MLRFRLALTFALVIVTATAQGVITTVAGNDAIFADDGKPAVSAGLAGPTGVAVDSAGNLFIVSPIQNMAFKVDTKGVISVVAGNGLKRYAGDGGPARAASLAYPTGVAVDRTGNVFIADNQNGVIRRVSTDGTITTVAGKNGYGFGGDGGPATQAMLAYPAAVAVDSAGNLYIADANNQRVRKVNTAGIISTFAGNGLYPNNGTNGDGGPAAGAPISAPYGVAVDAAGVVYIAGSSVRKVALDGTISTFAGGGSGGDGGPAASASVNAYGVALDSQGNLYIADQNNRRIRRVSAQGIITTIAGNGKQGFAGDGGAATQATLNSPSAVAADSSGNLYLADRDNDRVRRVDSGGLISTFAGQGASVGDGGPATSARLDQPGGIAVDATGKLYVADETNNRIRMVTLAGSISTIAGNGSQGYSGDSGPAANATINACLDVAVDSLGNLYLADRVNSVIRKVSTSGTITTYAGGTCCNSGDGGPATSARVSDPRGVAADPSGNIYIAENNYHLIRKVTPGGIISTIAGNGNVGFSGDGGPATAASFSGLFQGLMADGNGNVYVADAQNNRVRKIDSKGVSTTFAGNGNFGSSGDGGPATAAAVGNPQHMAMDKAGNVFISSANSVRVVRTDGTIHTYAGGDANGFSGDGGAALSATFFSPSGLATDSAGNLYVVDQQNRRVRLVQAGPSPSIIVSEKGLTFLAAAGGAPASQSFTIVNGGQGTLNWGVAASTASGGNWLSVTPSSGSSPAGGSGPPVQVIANAAGLAPGDYYGQIQITANGAPNSPQSVTVVLHVGTTGASAGSTVQPSGLLFTNATAQLFILSTQSTSPVTFTGTASFGSATWFAMQPTSGSVLAGKPATVQINPTLTGLAPGVYNGNITFAFSDNSLQNVQLLLVISPASSGSLTAHTACAPTKLLPLFTSLGTGFSITTGWPSPVEVRVVDDCANPLTRGAVTTSFSNGDSALTLTSLGDGRWTGTWQAQNASSAVSITASALSSDQQLTGAANVSGGLQQNANPPPVIAPGGVLNSASYTLKGSLAPGSLISIFGTLLSQGTVSAPSLPLPTTLGQTTITIAGQPLPLLYTSASQANAMIPYNLPINATHQAVIQRGTAISVPEPIGVLSSQSGVFTQDLTGQGQGIIVRVTADGTESVVTTTNPAHVFDAIVIYCDGLGDVTPRQVAGSATPFTPLSPTNDPVTVTVGGIDSPVIFAGLTPGLTGLYQINAYVPVGVAPGDNVPVVITQVGRTSPPVSISVR